MSGDRAALDRLLGVPEMAWLLARVRRRIPGAGDAPLQGILRLSDPTSEQRAAAWQLLGRPRRVGDSLSVDLAAVEEILRRGPWPAGLADAVETLSGPVIDHAAERDRARTAWDAARDALMPAAARFPGLASWWEQWCAAGGLKRAATAEATRTATASSPEVGARLATEAATVLGLLPVIGEPLAVLARRAVGDAHGLDSSRPLGRLAATVVRAAFLPQAGDDVSAREAWAAAGVILSTVASTVLCLGVAGVRLGSEPADARFATASMLEATRAACIPLVLTLDQARSGGVRPVPRDGTIHVCENPTVVEVAADRWARARAADPAPVLVCTSGQPSTAVIDLLAALTREGATVRYHGDFDWAGLRIARSLGAHVEWMPWRFEAEDYRAALTSGAPSRALTGKPAKSPWDPDLATAMTAAGLVVEEEAVVHALVDDLLGDRHG